MKFFADTANLEEIAYCFSKGVSDGITTNPKIIESTGDLSLGFDYACKTLVQKYNSVPVSLETDLRGINIRKLESLSIESRDVLLEQAEKLNSFGSNTIVKIPICIGGLEATKILSKRNIKTNITACMTPYQALEAANSGGTYVSLFANRMLDTKIIELSGYDSSIINEKSPWRDILKENKEKYFEKAWNLVLDEISYVSQKLQGTSSSLIVGSIRSPEDIRRIVTAGPQIITIPTPIVRSLEEEIYFLKNSNRSLFPKRDKMDYESSKTLSHPMTYFTLEEFEKAADCYRT